MDFQILIAFVSASVALPLIPGLKVILVLSQGHKVAVASAASGAALIAMGALTATLRRAV